MFEIVIINAYACASEYYESLYLMITYFMPSLVCMVIPEMERKKGKKERKKERKTREANEKNRNDSLPKQPTSQFLNQTAHTPV